MNATTAVVAGGLALALGVPGAMALRKERTIAEGTPVLLRLAPVDPRSLIQGDYMRLDYAIARETEHAPPVPRDGCMVVALDGSGVARFVRYHDPAHDPGPGERLLRIRRRGGRLSVGPDAFFFQEGAADLYRDAVFGELRVDEDGGAVLVGLRDANLLRLGPNR